MLEHAQIAREIVGGRSEHDLAGDRVERLALERAIEIVGEAASRLPDELQQRHCPDVPWGRDALVA